MKVDSNCIYYQLLFNDGWSIIDTIPKDLDLDDSAVVEYLLRNFDSVDNLRCVYSLYGPKNKFRRLIVEF